MKNIDGGNIPGYPNYYISRSGRLYSNRTGIWRRMSNKRIKNNGYVIATLYKPDGLSRRYFGIHQLVAMVYLPNPDNKPCVGHKDNVRTHNHVNNLYWCTHKENSQQMVRDGRHYVPEFKISTNRAKKLISDYLNNTYGNNYNLEKAYNIGHQLLYDTLRRFNIKPRRGHYRNYNKAKDSL